MRSVSIPVIYGSVNYDRAAILDILRRTKANRLMLAINRVLKDGKILADGNLQGLSEEIAFFEEEGFEVCVWIGETIGHGFPSNDKSEYRSVVNLYGNEGSSAFCPADERFVSDICAWIKNVARAGAKLILLDDDFRISNHGAAQSSVCCLCDYHLNVFCESVGEKLSREEIAEKVFTGGPSVYRDAWIAMMRDTMLAFAKKIRSAIDEVDPKIRIGLCGAPSMLDMDGGCNAEVLKTFAGENKALWRPCAAPYWAHDGFELARVILMQRLMACLYPKEQLEIIAEGDTYPRPRFACPSRYLEIYDEALAADGAHDGILKYMLEYAAPYGYETGFVDRHIRNLPLLKEIDETFQEGDSAGLRLYEHIECFRNSEFYDPDPYQNAEYQAWRQGIGKRFAFGIGAPIAFGGDYPVIVIGENARYIEKSALKNGAIIDAVAARILAERGVDTGMKSAVPVRDIVATEHFLSEDIHVTTANPVTFDVELANGANVLTYLEGARRHIGAYRYENAEGLRFLVYAFDGERTDRMLYRNYARQREIVRETQWLCGKKLPVSCTGNPDTYLFCKRNGNALTVGLWNIFPDEINGAEIVLSDSYKEVQWLVGNGEFYGDTVKADLAPYSFLCFVLKN